jgi:di/tricarboxylate transporter
MPTFEPSHIVLATVALSLVLFVTDLVRYDLIAVGVATALAATGVLTAEQAFSGFSSPAIMLIASMYVFGAAFTRWGLAEYLGSKTLGGAAPSELGLVLRVLLLSAVLSAFLSNAGVVAILIPVLSSTGRRARIPASKLMLPLAYGSLMGGLLTVIATSKNLAINGLMASYGHAPLRLFEFTPFGLILLAFALLYFLFPGRRLLPRSRVDETLTEHYQVPKFVTEVLVEPASTLINRSVGDTDFFERYGVTVLGIVRPDSTSVLAPGPYNRIRRDDTLVLQGTPDDILRLREDQSVKLVDSASTADTKLVADDVQLLEAVVPAGSRLDGRTLAEAEFRAQTGLNVLAVAKHGEVQPGRISEVRLEVGDTLLIQGHTRDVDRARRTREILPLDEVKQDPIGRGAWTTAACLAFVLIVAYFDWMPLSVAAVIGALALVFTGSLPAKDLYRSMDWSALVLIGGMLSLGKAFQVTRLDQDLAQRLGEFAGSGESPYLMIAALMAAAAILTQVTTHIAAAVIMTPVALSFADQLAVDDRAFVMAVLTGASLAFMSPVAHQANAMVVGPGDYKYRDFLKVGTPLLVLLFAVATFLIPWMFPLQVGP